MKALRIHQFGGPEQLLEEEVSMPLPERGEVLVRVNAAGVNPVDFKLRNGSLKLFTGKKFPRTLGFDIAGVVERADKSSPFKPGDRVFAMIPFKGGGYAEFVCVKSELLCPIPGEIDMIEAAATPLAALTALQAFRKKEYLHEGHKVLINGASGGVGSFAVQIAKALGAHVTAVASSKNLDFLKKIGADEVIDYTSEDFTKQPQQYHKVFDAVAKSSFKKCRRILRKGGNYVTTVPNHGLICSMMCNFLRKKKATYILVKPSGEDLHVIADMIATGQVRPQIEATFPLKEGQQAHRMLETGRVRGKLVLNMEQG
ncbi:MAG: NAD(P)-dependent alcohol dehydrogenase [Bacteroidales bacterium]